MRVQDVYRACAPFLVSAAADIDRYEAEPANNPLFCHRMSALSFLYFCTQNANLGPIISETEPVSSPVRSRRKTMKKLMTGLMLGLFFAGLLAWSVAGASSQGDPESAGGCTGFSDSGKICPS